MSRKLEETAQLLGNLEKVQHHRLGLPTLPLPPYLHPPSETEAHLADRITENLIDLAKQTVPRNIASVPALHKAMGIDLNAFAYQPPPPPQEKSASPAPGL